MHNPLYSLVPATPAPVVYAVFDVNRALQIIETTWNKVCMLFSTLLTRKLLKLKYANMLPELLQPLQVTVRVLLS